MVSAEDPTYIQRGSNCPFVSGNVDVRLDMDHIGGAVQLRRLYCKNYKREDKQCRDSTCSCQDGLCGYLNFPFISASLIG